MIRIKLKFTDGHTVTTDDRAGTTINIEGDIGEALQNIKKNNSPIIFNDSNGKKIIGHGKDLKSVEFILED